MKDETTTRRYNIFDSLIEGVQIIDRSYRYLYVNDSVASQGKYTKDELTGFTMMDKYPGIENTDVFRRIEDCMTNRRTHRLHNEFEFPDGSKGFFELRIQPVPEGVLVLSIDITELKHIENSLKQSEDRYRMIFDGIKEAFIVQEVVVDSNNKIVDLRFVELNPEAEKIFGRTREELIGRLRSEILGPLDREAMDIIERAVVKNESMRVERFIPSLGKWFETSVFCPKPTQIVNLVLDITERKHATDILKKLNVELEKRVKERTSDLIESLSREKSLNDMKSNFVSMASHEFRTPLSALLSSIVLIEKYIRAGDLDKCTKHIDRIKNSVRSLTDILDDFLSLEKLEQGRVEVVSECFDVREFTKGMVDELNGICKEGQRIMINHEGNNKVEVDKRILQNVLFNLLSNAIKYSDSDIELCTETDSMNLIVKVVDRGIGIPTEEQEKMFGRFFRAKNALNIEGTGLGLNIVKRYLELVEGTIDFESREDEGTTFTVTLPQKRVEETRAPASLIDESASSQK